MNLPVTHEASMLLLIVVVLGFGTGCSAQDQENFVGVAHAVASELDSLNGLPTAVLDEYRCDARSEPCRERARYEPASLVDAEAIVTAFAEARGISVVRYDDGEFPTCAWYESGASAKGLWAEFLGPPSIQGDSARVELATVCMAGSGFEQVHEFLLRFDEGEWLVVRRRLISIT